MTNVNKEACSCLHHGEGETGDMVRPPVSGAGHQVEAQKRPRRQLPLQETGADKGVGFGFNLANYVLSN